MLKKNIIFLLIVIFGLAGETTKAQDVLKKLDGNTYLVKILKVKSESIAFQFYTNSDMQTPVYEIPKADVHYIMFNNGFKEEFSIPEKSATQTDSSLIETNPIPQKQIYRPMKNGMVYLLNGEFYRAVVSKVTEEETRLRKLAEKQDFQEITSDSILMIAFDDGEALPFATLEEYELPQVSALNLVGDINIFKLGYIHAGVYYGKQNKVAKTALWINIFATPIIGFIYNKVSSVMAFKDEDLFYPSALLAEDADYSLGYKVHASEIKDKELSSVTQNVGAVYLGMIFLYLAGY